MPRTITDHEMKRRQTIAEAKAQLTSAMGRITARDSLTAMEWCFVLNELVARMIAHGLREEWEES